MLGCMDGPQIHVKEVTKAGLSNALLRIRHLSHESHEGCDGHDIAHGKLGHGDKGCLLSEISSVPIFMCCCKPTSSPYY